MIEDDVHNSEQELPSSFMVGEEYVDDPMQVEIYFGVLFNSATEVHEANIDYPHGNILISQEGPCIKAVTKRLVSQKLVKDWMHRVPYATQWIMGYVAPIMPYLNEELIRQRHQIGHFLMRNFSVFDILQIRISNPIDCIMITTPGPSPIAEFPPLSEHKENYSERAYIKDAIDACYSFFCYDFDDCLRKVITSVDAFFRFHNLDILAEENTKEPMFKQMLNKHLNLKCEMYDKQINEELWGAYQIRNEIVHEGKKYPIPELEDLSLNAIHCLFDVFKFNAVDEALHKYGTELEIQFTAQRNHLGSIVTIDSLSDH